MNRLSSERSAYLRHSAYQKIDWHPWSDEAFKKAEKEDMPVFLSTGAVWCHWCHVMAKECFEDEEIISLLNENFICIKLDRDERPDIDRRFQYAVAAMGSSTGWPLSVFLTPNKTPFFGGTYFPPEDMHGRPGFKKILNAVSELYRSKKSEVYEYSNKLMNLLKPEQLSESGISEAMLNDAVEKMISQFDPQNGGFGTAPKFPMPGAIEFLMNRYFFDNKESISITVRKTLEAMAKGGFHDQIGGGFHRYSTDESWIIPHFEKMADDNAWLLRNYINAYLLLKDEYFKDTAADIISFLRSEFSDPAGGFYASQDADITPDDEGGYFTWTEADFKKILNEEEYRILSHHFFHNRGTMHHDKSKKVLFVALEPEEISKNTGIDLERIYEVIKEGKKKLLRERNKREAPFIDRIFYTSLNGMLITAFLKAFRVFRDVDLKNHAIKSLEKIIQIHFTEDELFHAFGVKAMLDDYVFLAEALIYSYEITADKSYLDMAERLMRLCIDRFWDKNEYGFFDSEDAVLGLKLKIIEDIPHPSANSVAIILLLKLYHLTDNNDYLQKAEQALKGFYAKAKDMGIHASFYYVAIDAYFNMLRLALHTSLKSELTNTALSHFSPYTTVAYKEDYGYIIPCLKSECYEPLYSQKELTAFLEARRK